MIRNRTVLTCTVLILTLCFQVKASDTEKRKYAADLVVYGGTTAAITAAIQASKLGKSVIIVSPDLHLGGMTSSGLGVYGHG